MHLLRSVFIVLVTIAYCRCQDESQCFGSSETCKHKSKNVSPQKCLVFGPGLKSDLTLPARYFIIQAVDKQGENFTASPTTPFQVNIVENSNDNTKIWTQILNRYDGSFIVRYRLYKQMEGIRITITYNGTQVGASPYILDGWQYPESCICQKNPDVWLNLMGCPSSYTQLEQDLSVFPEIDLKSSLEEARSRFNVPGAYSFCHYQIVASNLHKKCYGQYVGFSMFMDEILLSLLRKIPLTDTEFLVNLGDWPLEHKSPSENPIPFFSWCGSKSTRDIVMPTYDLTESSLEMMGRVTTDLLSVQGATSSPRWRNKQEIGFWRGRDSRLERLQLVGLARKYPHLINASLTNFFFFQDKEAEFGPKADHISFFDFFQYKYQINIDGTVAAYRFPYLLAGDSVVLKQDSDFYEFFYSLLKPMVHYIPFKPDLSNLIEKIEWAKSNDEQAKKISENAREFVNQNLMPESIFCYYAVLLNKYTQQLKTPVIKLLNDMELVPQPVDKASCRCFIEESRSQRRDEF